MKQETTNIDISLLENNLKLTAEERILQHQKALDLVLELKKSKVITNEKSELSPKKTS